jgi:hypothetical protein
LSKPSSYLYKNIDKTIKYQPIWRKNHARSWYIAQKETQWQNLVDIGQDEQKDISETTEFYFI